jgi:2',3'-cyclic-nucleotide 2'-phosphodiesterase / 3'-nucleotidase
MRSREIEMDPPLAGSKPRLRLRLLGLTDLHANLYPYDYYRDCPDDSLGLARAASLVAEARREAPNCLLFDNGDILQGTPLGDLAAEAIIADPRAVHPVIAAMNTLDYAVALSGTTISTTASRRSSVLMRKRAFRSSAATSAKATARPGFRLRS